MSADKAEEIVNILRAQDWLQGKASSDYATGTVKQNKELLHSTNETVKEVLRDVHERMLSHQGLMNDCFTEHVMVPKFNRYDAGDAYYAHADAGLMGGTLRTDLAYTLFLNEDYKGGELCVNETSVRGAAGQIVVYECWKPHYVNQVLEGSRISAIGWIQSLVRDGTQREMLSMLQQVMKDIDRQGDEERFYAKLSSVYSKLVKMWIE